VIGLEWLIIPAGDDDLGTAASLHDSITARQHHGTPASRHARISVL